MGTHQAKGGWKHFVTIASLPPHFMLWEDIISRCTYFLSSSSELRPSFFTQTEVLFSRIMQTPTGRLVGWGAVYRGKLPLALRRIREVIKSKEREESASKPYVLHPSASYPKRCYFFPSNYYWHFGVAHKWSSLGLLTGL